MIKPLAALLALAEGRSAPPSRPGSAAPGSGGSVSAPQRPLTPEQQPSDQPVQLQLRVCSTSGRLAYGDELERHLTALLGAEASPFVLSGCSQTVHGELAAGGLTREAVAAAAAAGGGMPVAICVPCRQLLAGAAAAGPTVGEAPYGSDPDGPPEEGTDVWVCGRLQEILGKRLCTALDFGPSPHSSPDGGGSSQRVSLAVVRVAQLPDSNAARLDSAAFGSSWPAAPGTITLTWPTDQLWRLCGPSAATLVGSAGGIASSSGAASSQQQQQQQPGARQLRPPPDATIPWSITGYCSGAAVFAAADPAAGGAEAAASDGLHHKAQQAAAAGQRSVAPGGDSGSLLMRVELQHAELAVLAHLSAQPELQAACTAGCGAYERLSNVWAAATAAANGGQLHVPATGVLVGAAAARAAVHALVHCWSPKKLGWVLQVPRQAASVVLDSFLAAFPRLAAWLAEAAAAGEAAHSAATLAGRHRSFAPLKRTDDAMVRRAWWQGLLPCMGLLLPRAWSAHSSSPLSPSDPTLQARGKLHKAIMQHILEGSVADVVKAAVVATHSALAAARAPAAGSGTCSGGAPHQAPLQQRERPEVVLALGHSIVVRMPYSYIAAEHDGNAAAASTWVAAAVQRGLRHMRVGRALLAAPPTAVCTAGATLQHWDQRPVDTAAADAGAEGAVAS